MASRRKRPHTSTDEDEITIIDDVNPRQQKRRGRPKKKQTSPFVKNDIERDLLADIDLEGVLDEEKEQIKMALLASKENRHGDSFETDEEKDIVKVGLNEIETIPDEVDSNAEISDDDILTEKTKHTDDNLEESFKEQEVLLFSQSTLNDEDETQEPNSQLVEETQDYDIKPNCRSVNELHQEVNEKVDDEEQELGQPNQPQHSQCPTSRSPSTSFKINDWAKDEELREVKGRSTSRSNSAESQASGGFSPKMHDSDSQKSNSSEEPLQRHFRAVKYQLSTGPYYYCPEGKNIQRYAKVISQLFDIYNRKLKHAQQLVKQKMKWPEPVKTGQHHEKSIDAKRRGQDVFYFDLSDNEDFMTENTKKGPIKREYKLNANDNDLPELFVEKPEKRQTGQVKEPEVKKTRFTLDEAVEIISREKKQRPVEEKTNSKMKGLYIIKKGAAEQDIGATRKMKSGSKKVGQVLVEDTQMDDNDDDFIEMGKETKMDTSVEETQFCDEDEWLSINKGINRVGQTRQRGGLRGYTIPRNNNIAADSHYSDMNNDKELDIKRNTVKKRKIETRPKTIIEDTQDFGFDELVSKSKTSKRFTKHECFKIDSSSDSESVAETQNNNSSSKEDEKETEQHGLLGKFKSTVKNIISYATQKSEDSTDTDAHIPLKRKAGKQLYTEKLTKFDQTPDLKARNRIETDNLLDDGMFLTKAERKLEKKSAIGAKSFSRNRSRDSILSNNSDDVSVSSSQISTTLLDDNGDFYSTQFCEMNTVKNSGKKRKVACLPEDIEHKATRTQTVHHENDSDEDVVMIDIDVKGTNHDNRKERGKDVLHLKKKLTRNSKIDQCFGKDEETIKKSNNIDSDHADLDENPLPKTYSNNRQRRDLKNSGKRQKRNSESTMSWNMKDDDDTNSDNLDNKSQPGLKDKQSRTGWVTEQIDLPPVEFQNFSHGKQSKRVGRNVKMDERKQTVPDLFDVDSDEGHNVPTSATAHQKEPVEMIQCPMCGQQFSVDTIQEHAGDCDGPTPGDGPQLEENNIATNGELEPCWICEKQIPKVGSEKHVEECWRIAEQREKQQQNIKEEPVQTRRGKQRQVESEEPITPRRLAHRNKEQNDRHQPRN